MKKLILIIALLLISTLYPQGEGSAVSSQGSSDNIANTLVRRDASGDFVAGNVTIDGNMGIGRIAPISQLHVESDGTGAQITVTGKTDATANAILLLSATGATNAQGLKVWYEKNTAYGYIDNLYNNDAGNIYIRTKTAGTPINALTILGTGEATFIGRVTADRFRAIHATSTDVSALPVYVSETLSGNFGLASTPAYGMTVYSKILGANLTATDAYESAITGLYGITGTNASVYPKAGVLGWIADNTTTADGAFIALIDGDTQITQAGAAYGVRYLNSTPGSGFAYGLDLYSAAIRGYDAVSYRTADIRLGNSAIFDNSTVDLLTITEANIELDGDVSGTGNIKGATLESNSGTTINEFSVDGTLGGDSDDAVPTEKAVKAYVDGAGSTDDQKIDVFSISGDNVQLSLENDGEATKTVDISSTTAVTANSNKVGVAANVVDGTHIALGSDAQGDIMYYGGTDWERLGFGDAGKFLQTNGTSANPTWESASSLWTDDGARTYLTEQSEPLEIRKSGLGHGMTSLGNTDAYFVVKINDGSKGGVTIYGIAGDNLGADDGALHFRAVSVDGTPTEYPMKFSVGDKSGTTWGSYSGTVPAFEWTNGGSEQLMALDTDGDLVIQGVHTLFGQMGEHASAGELVINISSVNYGVTGEFSGGKLNGFTFVSGSADDASAVIRDQIVNGAGLGAGVDSLTIWQDAHGLLTGDFIAVQSASHSGLVEVVRIDADSIHVKLTYSADEVCNFQEGDYLLASAGTAGEHTPTIDFTIAAGAASKEYHFHLVQNITLTDASFTITTRGTQHQSGCGSDIITVSAGDRFWMVIENETDTENLDYEDAQIIIRKL